MAKKQKDLDEFLKINNSIRLYGGLYIRWKNSGMKLPVPVELMESLIDVQATVDANLMKLAGVKFDQ